MLTPTLNHALWVVQKFYYTSSLTNCKGVGDMENEIYVSREPMRDNETKQRKKLHC